MYWKNYHAVKTKDIPSDEGGDLDFDYSEYVDMSLAKYTISLFFDRASLMDPNDYQVYLARI